MARVLICWLAGLSLLLTSLLTSSVSMADALFESDEPLSMSIEAPFSKIRRERDKSESYEGRLSHEGNNYNVILAPRGNTRLNKRNCRYPPLWVDMEKSEIDDSLFDHQKHVKLVVQCKNGDKYRDYVRGEYLTYKLLAMLTPNSFKVRWVDMTYIDGKTKRQEPAFFIERKSRLAKRTGNEKASMEKIGYSQLSRPDNAIATLFQYVVANPDFSFVVGIDGDCCHNSKLLQNELGLFIPVPYDFDSSGLVNTEYAVPAKHLGIRRVTTRLYRGHCMHNDDVSEVRDKFLSMEEEMIALFANDPQLGLKSASKMAGYLEASFEILRNDKTFQSEILDACRSRKKS